jgi:hypothetical protein
MHRRQLNWLWARLAQLQTMEQSRDAPLMHRREGRYLLRTNLTETDPVKLWNYYRQLGQVELAAWRYEAAPRLATRPL